MKVTIVGWVFFVCLAFASSVTSTYPPPLGITIKGVITEVTDGDTLKVTPEVPPISIRLEDCRAPELSQRGGKKAKLELESYAKGQKALVHLNFLEHSRTGETRPLGAAWSLNRWVGTVWIEKDKRRSLSEWQIARGNASPVPGDKWGE